MILCPKHQDQQESVISSLQAIIKMGSMFLCQNHREQQESGTSSPRAIIELDSVFLRPYTRPTRIMSLAQEAPSRLFRAPFSMGPKLVTTHEIGVEQGSPGQTIAPRVHMKKWIRISSGPLSKPRSSLHWATWR